MGDWHFALFHGGVLVNLHPKLCQTWRYMLSLWMSKILILIATKNKSVFWTFLYCLGLLIFMRNNSCKITCYRGFCLDMTKIFLKFNATCLKQAKLSFFKKQKNKENSFLAVYNFLSIMCQSICVQFFLIFLIKFFFLISFFLF